MIAQHVYGVFANLLLGTHAHIQAVIDLDLLPQFIARLGSEDADFRLDSIHALRNISERGSVPQQLLLAELNAVSALCNLLGTLNSTYTLFVLKVAERLLFLASGTPL